jgi:hypothetical protein
MAPPCHRKKSRAAKATEAVPTDSLVSLPLDVLGEILTRLELRDAVRTSALSRAWRHRWESLPSLDIHIPDVQSPLWAVDSILLRCSGRVRSFHINLDELSARRLHDWLFVLSRRGVENLHLSPHGDSFSVHCNVFFCRHLISLDLFACDIPPLPQGFEGFPDLKVLSLAHVKLHDNGEYQLEEIIERSPLLESLVLTEVGIGGDYFIEWEIRAPNLRH